MVNEKTFDELREDEKIILTEQITEEKVALFAQLTGDNNPLHMDEEFGKKSMFRGRIAHGMLMKSFFSTIAGMHLPGKHSLILSSEAKFKKPITIGETIRIVGTIQKKIPATKIIIVSVNIHNEKGDVAVEGTMNIKVLA